MLKVEILQNLKKLVLSQLYTANSVFFLSQKLFDDTALCGVGSSV